MIFISLWKGSSINEGSKECIHPAELLREKQACEKISNWILGKYFREYDIETCMSANSTIGKAEHMHLAGRWGHLCITAYVKATYSDLCKHTLWPLKASDELGGSASDFCTVFKSRCTNLCFLSPNAVTFTAVSRDGALLLHSSWRKCQVQRHALLPWYKLADHINGENRELWPS